MYLKSRLFDCLERAEIVVPVNLEMALAFYDRVRPKLGLVLLGAIVSVPVVTVAYRQLSHPELELRTGVTEREQGTSETTPRNSDVERVDEDRTASDRRSPQGPSKGELSRESQPGSTAKTTTLVQQPDELQVGGLQQPTVGESGATTTTTATTTRLPATTKVKPATTTRLPATTKVKPATTTRLPATTKVKPATTKRLPATTKAQPSRPAPAANQTPGALPETSRPASEVD